MSALHQLKLDRVTTRLILLACSAIPILFFLNRRWANAFLLSYLLTGCIVVVLAENFPPFATRSFWKASVLLTCIHLVIVAAFVWLEMAVPEVNELPRMLYGFAVIVFFLECRVAFWIIDGLEQ